MREIRTSGLMSGEWKREQFDGSPGGSRSRGAEGSSEFLSIFSRWPLSA